MPLKDILKKNDIYKTVNFFKAYFFNNFYPLNPAKDYNNE